MAFRALVASIASRLLVRFPRTRVLGLGFLAGVSVLVIASWILGMLAEDVADGEAFSHVDLIVGRWVLAHEPGWMPRAAFIVSRMHDTLAILAYVGALGIYLLLKRQAGCVRWLLLSVPGGMFVNFLEKLAFHRARPDFGHGIETVSTYSFPSGHAAAATLLYGWLALYLTRNKGWRPRMLAYATAAVSSVVVALSRMALGVHFLTDVLAAFAGAIAWLALAAAFLMSENGERDSRGGG